MPSKTYAVIEGEDVVNLILWDDSEDEYVAPEGQTVILAPEDVAIGWKRVSEDWVAPTPPAPEPPPEEDPTVRDAKLEALRQLVELGITEPVARTIVGLPPA